jgi:hypothetical protein
LTTLISLYHAQKLHNSIKVIAYRRVAGKIGLTANENGIRGAWVEKRIALMKHFLNLNYQIVLLSETTETTKQQGYKTFSKYQPCDLLVVEFGGNNLQFYKKDWFKTLEIIKAHTGQILFLIDDPDLPFLWHLLPDEDWSRWTIAANAVNTNAVREVLKVPAKAKVVDYPMMPEGDNLTFNAKENSHLIYIGRPNGRKKYLNDYTQSDHLRIAGQEKDWRQYDKIKLLPYPQQRHRKQFYQQFSGCLAISDNKHIQTGWRTGRAYHALYAGIPVFAPLGNAGLNWCSTITQVSDLSLYAQLPSHQLETIWLKQKEIATLKPLDPFAL